MSRLSLTIFCVLALLPFIHSQQHRRDSHGRLVNTRPVRQQTIRTRKPNNAHLQHNMTNVNGKKGDRARQGRAKAHGRPIVTERILKPPRSVPGTQQVNGTRPQGRRVYPSARVNNTHPKTSQTRARTANKNSFKNRPGYSQVAGRLLFASLVNDIVEGVPLYQAGQGQNAPRRALPSPDRRRLGAFPKANGRDLSRQVRRPSFNVEPPRKRRPIPHPRFIPPRPRANQQRTRVRRPQFATNQRQPLPPRPPVRLPSGHMDRTRHVVPVRRPQPIQQARPFPRPQPQVVMQRQVAIPPPPQPPLQLTNWNNLPNNLIDPRFNLLNQRSFLPPQQVLKRPQLTANEKLGICCEKQHLSPNCQAMCNYETFTQQSLVSTFLTNSCPTDEIGLALECASSRADHTECCTQNGLATYNGGLCMTFCRAEDDRPNNPMHYVGCLPVFNAIKDCYRQYQETHPNIFGDFRR